MSRRILLGALLFVAIVGIVVLTCQTPEQTKALSDGLRDWLNEHGLTAISKDLRKNIHIIEYFIFGIALGLFGHAFGWKLWTTLLTGYTAGLLDEVIKVFLPTREFDSGDLVRDVIGVSIAVLLIFGLLRVKNRL